MQNLCSKKRKNVCIKEYLFEIIIDKQMFARYNLYKTYVRNKCSTWIFILLFYFLQFRLYVSGAYHNIFRIYTMIQVMMHIVN